MEKVRNTPWHTGSLDRLFDRVFFQFLRVDETKDAAKRPVWAKQNPVLGSTDLSVFRRVDFSAYIPDVVGEDNCIYYHKDKIDSAMAADLGVMGEIHSPDTVWPLDVSFAIPHGKGDQGTLDGFNISRTRSVSRKDVRGLIKIVPRHIVRIDAAKYVASEANSYRTNATILGFVGNSWRLLPYTVLFYAGDTPRAAENNWIASSEAVQDTNLHMSTIFRVAVKHRYEWSVEVAYDPAMPSLRFATDFTGLKELFARREKDKASDRRKALKTWVLNHWRIDHNTPEDEIFVRKHFRGAEVFDWAGYQCRIHASPFDIEQKQKLQTEREALARQGKTRRRRK